MPIKIEQIKSVGRFVDYKSKGDVTFKPLVTVFAPNGNGKSTLCDIFRSVQSGDSGILMGRHTLSSQEKSSVAIKLQGGSQATFNGNKWGRVCPDIHIFDEKFVEETIYSSNVAEPKQREKLYQVVVGRNSVQFQKKIELIGTAIKAINKKIKIAEEKLGRQFPRHTVSNILKIYEIDKVDEKIEETKVKIGRLKKANEIKKRSVPKCMENIFLPIDLKASLETGLPELVTQARGKISGHLESKKMQEAGENWLRSGMEWAKNDICPFCGQALTASELYEHFEEYFSETYELHIDKIQSTLADIEAMVGHKKIDSIRSLYDLNKEIETSWSGELDNIIEKLDFEKDVKSALADEYDKIIQALELKLQNPSVAQNIVDEENYCNGLEEVSEVIGRYNDSIAKVCQEILNIRQAIKDERLETQEKTLERLEEAKLRYADGIVKLCRKYSALQKGKSNLNEQKKELREKLDLLSQEVLSSHLTQINEILRQFGVDFRLGGLATDHTGGVQRTGFTIVMRGKELKTTAAQPNSPHLGNTLSSGDKRALAFAFFLSIVCCDDKLDSKLVIFDDPFSSLDSFRRSRTKDRILSLVNKARVVMVLSHDIDFLWHVSEKAGKKQKHLKVEQVAEGSVIVEWEIEVDVLNNYQKSLKTLREYVQGESKKELLDVAKCLRPSLEGMFRREFPEKFRANDWLQNMIEAVNNSSLEEKISRFMVVASELTDIKNYSSPFHHSDERKDNYHIDSNELSSYAQSVLSIIDGEFEQSINCECSAECLEKIGA
ncbi:AAA family ATPase [Halodesulfovibrio aestuarii]|uniref:AAA family ATPase n=1 Tax=Halodesulfovibrio aestuarii TaxID=126333 RepID=UPI003D32F2DB